MKTIKDYLIEVLSSLGGSASLQEIYDFYYDNTDGPLPPTWKACIRRTIESNSSDSANFNGKDDVFYSVHGIGSGVWGLR